MAIYFHLSVFHNNQLALYNHCSLCTWCRTHFFIISCISYLSVDDLQSFKSYKISARFICRIKNWRIPSNEFGMAVVCEDKNWFSVSCCIEFNEFPLFMKCKIKGEEKKFSWGFVTSYKINC